MVEKQFRQPFEEQSDQSSVLFSLQIPGHQSVFINEPRLSDFKQVLLREGIQAEFVGGVLVCNNMVAVRRVSPSPWLTEHAIHPLLATLVTTSTQRGKWPAHKTLQELSVQTK